MSNRYDMEFGSVSFDENGYRIRRENLLSRGQYKRYVLEGHVVEVSPEEVNDDNLPVIKGASYFAGMFWNCYPEPVVGIYIILPRKASHSNRRDRCHFVPAGKNSFLYGKMTEDAVSRALVAETPEAYAEWIQRAEGWKKRLDDELHYSTQHAKLDSLQMVGYHQDIQGVDWLPEVDPDEVDPDASFLPRFRSGIYPHYDPSYRVGMWEDRGVGVFFVEPDYSDGCFCHSIWYFKALPELEKFILEKLVSAAEHQVRLWEDGEPQNSEQIEYWERKVEELKNKVNSQ